MPQCCVPNCRNSTDNHSKIRFYCFPRKSLTQRELWLNAVRNVMPDSGPPWRPVPKTVICSAHFVNGKKSNDVNSESYCPNIFPNYQKSLESPTTTDCEPVELSTTSIDHPQQIEEAKNLSPDSDHHETSEGAESDLQNQDRTMETGAVFTPKGKILFPQRRCSVKGCNSHDAKDRNIAFHKFPIRSATRVVVQTATGKVFKDRLSLWLEKCQIKRKEDLLTTSKVCSLHFTMDDYSKSGYENHEKTKKILKLNAYPTLNLPPSDEAEDQKNSVSCTQPPERCKTPRGPSSATASTSGVITPKPKRPKLADHCYSRQSIDIDAEQDKKQWNHLLEDKESGSVLIIPGLWNKEEPSHGLSNETEPSHELSNTTELLIKQEPDDQLEIHEGVETTEKPRFNLIQHEFINCNEIKQECRDIVKVEIKQETEDDLGTYPNVVPPETIFLSEFPLQAEDEQPSSDDEIQITSVCSLAPPHSSTEKNTQKVTPGTSKEKKIPSCSSCKLTFRTLPQFLNHECETLVKLHTGSMWRCQIWQCEFCNNVFDSEQSLETHIEKKHGQRSVAETSNNTVSKGFLQIPIFSRVVYNEFYTHLCMYHVKFKDDCENRMIANSLLIEILEEHNLKGKSHQCVECSHATYATKAYFNHHFKSIHDINKIQDFVSCKLCFKCHKDVTKMEAHLKTEHLEYWKHRVGENCLYRCATCEDKFASCLVTEKNYGLVSERSIDLKHFDVTRIVATGGKCYFQYSIKQERDDHQFRYNYRCALCKPAVYFHSETELNLHLKSHDDGLAFRICRSCSVPCYSMSEFYDHVKGGCENSELNFQHSQTNDSRSTTCGECSVTLVNHCSYKIHELTSHSMKQFDFKLYDGEYSCPICKVIFSDPKCLFAHCAPYCILIPEKYATYCEQCFILLPSEVEFREHSIRVHQEPNCFKCKICDVGLDKKLQLDKHVTKEHNTQLIHCTQCFANVRIKPKLTITHFQSCNIRPSNNERLYSCPICGLRLETFNTLINHIKIDMQLLATKKYQCQHCFNYFFTEYNLCAHIVNGKCKSCNLYFCGKQKLAEHLAGPCGV